MTEGKAFKAASSERKHCHLGGTFHWDRKAWVWGFWLVFLVSLFVRWHGLEPNTLDLALNHEYHYIWSGLALADGWPAVSNAALMGGKEREGQSLVWLPALRLGQRPAARTSPMVHQPPLFRLITGSIAKLLGAKAGAERSPSGISFFLADCDVGRTRYLALALFGASFLFLYLAGRQLLPAPVVFLALLFYGVFYPIVLHTRLLVPGNLVTPLVLCGLWLAGRRGGAVGGERLNALGIFACCLGASLSELAALPLVAGICLYAWALGRRSAALCATAGLAAGLGAYAGFEYYRWGFEGWHAMAGLVDLSKGPSWLGQFFPSLHTYGSEDYDFPLLAAWIAFFACLLRGWKPRFLMVPLLYLGFAGFLFASPVDEPWRMLPLYPFLCIALSSVFWQLIKNPRPVAFVGFYAMLLPFAFDVIFIANGGNAGFLRWLYLSALCFFFGLSFLQQPMARKIVRLSVLLVAAQVVFSQVWRCLLKV